jgi:hypothetical protein
MVEISRNLLLRNGYDTPPVRKNAFHPRGLRCMTL